MSKTLVFTDAEVEALADLLDWAHNEALTKMVQYRKASEKYGTNTQACVDAENNWAERADAIRKLKVQNPTLDVYA